MMSSEGASTSSSNRVHFTMTVKVDIEAPAPTASPTAATLSSSSSSASSSTICAAAAAAATATAAGTQDLLLKLQPLLPHLCITPPRHQQHRHHQDPSPTTQQGGAGGRHLESGLELSLGLSSFAHSGVSSCPPSPLRDEEQQCDDRVLAPAGSSGVASVNVGSARQPSLARSDSLPVNWRVLEQQRLKREVQCQKRQEARKKRRILIEEQKQQRRKSSGSGTTSSHSHHHPRKKPVVKDEADMEDRPTENKATRPGRGHSHAIRKSRRSLDSSAATLDSSSAGNVKAEATDATARALNTCTTAGTSTSFSGVIRPSAVHEPKTEWIDKFLEMRKMVRPDDGGEEATLPDDQLPVPPRAMGSSQSSSAGSSSVAMVMASGSFACPSSMEQKVVISSREDGDVRLPPPAPPPPLTPPPPPSLLRSSSLGANLRQGYLLQQQQQQQQQQRSSTLRAPSPVRCNRSLMRTLSEGAAMRSSMGSSVDSWSRRSSTSSAFRSPKKPQQEQQVDGAVGWEDPERSSQAAAMVARSSSSSVVSDLPWVTTTGTGPNGKTVTGVLFAYKKGEVKIVCACHGRHMSAKEFVEHAGGVDVANPEKCIVVSPGRRTATQI
ncbi:hypothetical protein SELMODRAFT_447751 [Selaginella moellendorffii]|uniref:Tify domain-containing protein n=1 Tax=Selaginella moellendorffii TaxID=88036 RepID=D8T213_SELML|nr:uncharacterized protein LOC9637155 [Selaginella moellendorffii]EFJ09324.1 hypothetical protein SELMODRAFT_447751 [Selaginella moellendorffii]|eukprot:XP_002989654.1 uncharacterized protein LOC9637155 [Selaginella moellendorffii]